MLLLNQNNSNSSISIQKQTLENKNGILLLLLLLVLSFYVNHSLFNLLLLILFKLNYCVNCFPRHSNSQSFDHPSHQTCSHHQSTRSPKVQMNRLSPILMTQSSFNSTKTTTRITFTRCHLFLCIPFHI